MKVATTLTLATAALAAPSLEKTQRSCVAFVFARGSTEPAPLVRSRCTPQSKTDGFQGLLVGLPLEPLLKRKIPNLKTFPVLYGASLATNISPARTDAKSINTGVQTFERAAKACPIIIAGGYSQGAAVMHNVIGKRLSSDIKSRIAGVALYGDTRNKQDHGVIPNFPADRVKVW
jgi:cutinase